MPELRRFRAAVKSQGDVVIVWRTPTFAPSMQPARYVSRAGSLHLDEGLLWASRQRRLLHSPIERSNFIVPTERLFFMFGP